MFYGALIFIPHPHIVSEWRVQTRGTIPENLSLINREIAAALQRTGSCAAIDFSPSATDNYVSSLICGGVDVAMKVPVVRNVA